MRQRKIYDKLLGDGQDEQDWKLVEVSLLIRDQDGMVKSKGSLKELQVETSDLDFGQ